MGVPDGVRLEHVEPLWTRVDRNRAKFVLFVGGYLLSIALSAAVVTALVAAVAGLFLLRAPETAAGYYANLGAIAAAGAAASVVVGAAWVAWALTRSEKRLLGRLGAVLTPTGSLRPTKLALKDMAIAAGFVHAPPLWIIPDCDRVNAFAVGRSPRTAVVGVTQGFADRLTAEEQRAVFANLIARLGNGDVRWATAVSSLVGPLWAMRERDLRRDEEDPLTGERAPDDPVALSIDGAARARSGEAASGAVVAFVVYALMIVVTEVLLAGHQRSTRLTAEKADAEGMLLLKDPREMLTALEKVLEANNTVPTAGEAYSALFYCWAGFGYAPEDDPEFARVIRLREVLGAEGIARRPASATSARSRDLLPPDPPRMTDPKERTR